MQYQPRRGEGGEWDGNGAEDPGNEMGTPGKEGRGRKLKASLGKDRV